MYASQITQQRSRGCFVWTSSEIFCHFFWHELHNIFARLVASGKEIAEGAHPSVCCYQIVKKNLENFKVVYFISYVLACVVIYVVSHYPLQSNLSCKYSLSVLQRTMLYSCRIALIEGHYLNNAIILNSAIILLHRTYVAKNSHNVHAKLNADTIKCIRETPTSIMYKAIPLFQELLKVVVHNCM